MISVASGILPLCVLLVTGLLVLGLDMASSDARSWNGYVGIAGFLTALLSIPLTKLNIAIPGFYVDEFALLGMALIILCGILVMIYSMNYFKRHDASSTEWTFLLLSAAIGLCIMFSTRHLLVLFVGLEMSSLAFYVLCGYRRTQLSSMESSLKYFILGSVGSAVLLLGMALLFVNQQTLLIHEFRLTGGSGSVGFLASSLVVLIGLGFKLSLIPVHVWVPDVYEGAPTPITGFMSVAVKVAVLSFLIRFFAQTVDSVTVKWSLVFWWLSAVTMLGGNLLALVQNKLKRMLAYSSIAHAGYLTLGVVAANRTGFVAIQFYLLVYILMNLAAFGFVHLLEEGNDPLRFVDLRGLSRHNALLAFSIAVVMISLAGLPPTGGFMGKFMLFNGVAQAGYPMLAVIAVLGSLISVAYYFRVIVNAYMVEPADESQPALVGGSHIARYVTLLLAIAILYLGISPYGAFIRIHTIIEML